MTRPRQGARKPRSGTEQPVRMTARRVNTPGCFLLGNQTPTPAKQISTRETSPVPVLTLPDITVSPTSAEDVSTPPFEETNIMVSPSDTSSISVQSLAEASVSTPSAGEDNIMVSMPGTSSSSGHSPKKSNRPKFYMTKYRKVVEKKNKKTSRTHIYAKAKTDLEAGKFKSVRQCAAFHKVPVTTLYRLYIESDEYKGSGRKSLCLTPEEETVIMNHVKWRSQIGCGMDFSQLQSLVQKTLLALVSANPDRKTGYEDVGQRPNRFFIRRLVERHNLSLRRTAKISKGQLNI